MGAALVYYICYGLGQTDAPTQWTEMTDQTPRLTLEDVYGAWNSVPDEFWDALERSHAPRPREMLYDKMGEMGCGETHHLLDIGCWAARHACELARRFGCRVSAVDYLDDHVEQANDAIEGQKLTHLVKASQGDIHSLSFPDGEFDYIWCRDMLPNVRDVGRAFAECHRVLKGDGKMLIFTDFETDLMEPREAARLYADAVHPKSVSRASVERAIHDAGLFVDERQDVGTEFKEWDEENKGNVMGKESLYIARMMRSRETLIARFGEKVYEAELIGLLWDAYVGLGKLMPVVYVLSKPA